MPSHVPTAAEMKRADRRRRRFASVAVKATSILDEAGYERGSAVFWRDELGAFVLESPGSKGAAGATLVYLGPTPMAAIAWARRRRWEANAGRRATAAKVATAAIAEVGGLLLDIVPSVLR